MSAFPDGAETRADAIRLLQYIDGEELETAPWDIDDFTSIPKSDPVVERCRVRVRDELLDLLASKDPVERERIPTVVADILGELKSNA
jgi:hypothetical protein